MKLATALAIVVVGILLGIWFWSRACQFPWIVWNDMRLAPAVAFAQGWPVYSTADHGVINTWIYGPLPLFFYSPAALAPTAAGALVVAGVLNLTLTVVPIALVCFGWPGNGANDDPHWRRIAAFLLCLALWTERHYAVLFADNLAIACGLIANLALVRAPGPRGRWLAALLAASALACKQIAVGIPLAQVLWIGITADWKEGLRHAGRCATAGAVLSAAAIGLFGWPGLRFTLLELPGNFPWEFDLTDKFHQVAPELLWQIVVPVLAIAVFRRQFRQPALLLPALAWACTLPFGLAAVFKIGGWLNSLHSVLLWLPPVVTALLTTPSPRLRLSAPLAATVAALAVMCGRTWLTPHLPLQPMTSGYREAARLAARLPQQIWFPFHPLVTLYSDHRYYHDEDGFHIRRVARKPITPSAAAGSLPPAMHLMAFHNEWNDRGFARSMMPANAHRIPDGDWTLLSAVDTSVP